MPSLLLIVFLFQLLIHIINTVGAGAINSLLWLLYNKFPTPTSKAARDQAKLRREVFQLRQELNSTSSQDEFAKWARLRRQYDKLSAELQRKTADLQDSKASFDKTFNLARWIGTTGLRLLLQFWYSKKPLFWIPQGWLPYYVEWLLAFPRAPTGSVSIQVWGIACVSVISLVSEGVMALYMLAAERRASADKGEPQKFAADGKTASSPTASEQGKKEL